MEDPQRPSESELVVCTFDHVQSTEAIVVCTNVFLFRMLVRLVLWMSATGLASHRHSSSEPNYSTC